MTARAQGDGGRCFVAEWGTCGDARYIDEIEGGLVGLVRYYDDRGSLISIQHYNIEHPGLRWDGPPQTCMRKRIRDLCERPR